MALKIRSIRSSPPTPLKINEKIEAPMRMVKIIVETIAVFSLVSFKKLRLNFPFTIVISIAPIAPIAEASVGVAIPAIIEPRTIIISIKGRARVFNISVIGVVAASDKETILGFFEF